MNNPNFFKRITKAKYQTRRNYSKEEMRFYLEVFSHIKRKQIN